MNIGIIIISIIFAIIFTFQILDIIDNRIELKKPFIYTTKENTDMTKPLECPTCKGHIQLDLKLIKQIILIKCPYCNTKHKFKS